MAPSAEPAPTMVCNSSMKRITFLDRLISSMTAFDSLLELTAVFGSSDHEGEVQSDHFLSRRISGTLPLAISWASPSAIAVLPTPASPMRTGLFLVRRHRIWMTLSISGARPITGSSSAALANSVRSRPKAFKAGVLPSFLDPPVSDSSKSFSPPRCHLHRRPRNWDLARGGSHFEFSRYRLPNFSILGPPLHRLHVATRGEYARFQRSCG